MIRALLVDDEQPARERLRQLLAAHADLEIVGEAEDGEQAIEKILELRPELVFLDIQMPGCSGLEVAASLPNPCPRIIFCTAFDEYAVDAFELQAIDYLLKPVSRARLDKSLGRVRESPVSDPTKALARGKQKNYPTRFLAKRSSRFWVIPSADILFFSSEEGLTKLQTEKLHYWMQPTLTDLETRLDPSRFFRISRAVIVNLDAVREILPLGGGQGEVRLTTDLHLEVSRRRFKPLWDRLSKS